MWNFGVPPQLKAYIDTICIAKKTFAFTEQGAVGLLKGKHAVHIQAGGGTFAGGEFDFSNRYLQAILGFMGLHVESVIAEGMAMQPAMADEIFASAVSRARELARQFAIA